MPQRIPWQNDTRRNRKSSEAEVIRVAVELPDDFKELANQKRRLKALETEYEYLRNRDDLGATNYDKVTTVGGVPTDFTDRVVNKLDVKDKLELERRNLSILIARILCKLNRMKNRRESALLQKRYLFGLAWDIIEESTKEDRRQLFRIHESAIKSYKALK